MNEQMIDQIEQEVNDFMVNHEKIQAGTGNFYGNDKAKLSTLSRYSKMLQYHEAMGNEKAAELKGNIDNFLSQFDSSISMKREVKPLTMQDYYQQTKQYSQFAR